MPDSLHISIAACHMLASSTGLCLPLRYGDDGYGGGYGGGFEDYGAGGYGAAAAIGGGAGMAMVPMMLPNGQVGRPVAYPGRVRMSF